MRAILLVFFLFIGSVGFAQTDTILKPKIKDNKKAWVSLRIHPMRMIYGLNGGIDVRITNKFLVGFSYVDHKRDFMSPFNDPWSIELRPVDPDPVSFMADVQLYFETRQVVFHGPRFALKRLTFETADWVDDDTEETYQLWRDQQNWYLSYSVGFRRIDRGFFVMAYATAGAVLMRANEYDSREASFEFRENVLPYVMVGIGVGWSI